MAQFNEADFWAKVHRHRPDACWTWLGAKDGHSYGYFYVKSRQRQMRAHRVAYELLVGSIPEGLQLDHLCRNPSCVNPAHLEPVTQRENGLRSDNLAGRNARKTHCPYGHPYDEANTYRRGGGGRRCRQCGSKWSNELNKRKRALLTHCSKGHPLSGDNLHLDAMGRRRCRQCDGWDRRTLSKAYCKNGHLYADKDLDSLGRRRCGRCKREGERRRYRVKLRDG